VCNIDLLIILYLLQYVQEVSSLAESKSMVWNILVDHVCSVWRGHFNTTQLFSSLLAKKDLLLMAVTFGTVHRKNLRYSQPPDIIILHLSCCNGTGLQETLMNL